MSCYTSTIIHPNLTTKVRMLDPDTSSVTGKPIHITVVSMSPDVQLQWSTPAEALAWLDHCYDAVLDAMDAHDTITPVPA